MGLTNLDYLIVCAYLIGVTLAGSLIAGKQKSYSDYFLGGKKLSWWLVGFSIVASETSTLTFISIPGMAYSGTMYFLQVAFGYFIGRLLVSIIFIPSYYKGNLVTAYDFIGKRFGIPLRKFTSSVFIITRVLASGVRLFATAIPLHLLTGLDYPTSILIIGISTLIYTYIGGLKAVVMMDVVQLFIYLSGAVISMIIIINTLPGGLSDVMRYAHAQVPSKMDIFNTKSCNSLIQFLSSPYTLLGGILGGTFLTMASHGTDQLLVQRLLGCSSKKESQMALMLDASIIVVQFAFFLFLGICLYAFYGGVSYNELGLSSSDEVFPKFIVENLPAGITGLVLAGVFASAMGSLSSSISSLASSSYLDLFRSTSNFLQNNGRNEIKWSRFFTMLWGIVLIGGAMLFKDTKNPVVEIGLQIASITYGGLLGTFFLGLLFPHINQTDAFIGLVCGLIMMVLIITQTNIGWTWHTFIGSLTTIITANISTVVSNLFKKLRSI